MEIITENIAETIDGITIDINILNSKYWK